MRAMRLVAVAAILLLVGNARSAPAQTAPYVPTVGQVGKDVVWVPTPPELVEAMLDLARVTAADLVIDLGSGDGRAVIAAARRGARSLGVEYNPDMVALSRRLAAEAGVADRATFVEGDMFQADFSQATVLALFLLPDNLRTLRPKFLDLQPGTRIVLNTFSIPDWSADEVREIQSECTSWCTARMWIVPARVHGTWRFAAGGELRIDQRFQVVSGTLAPGAGTAVPIGGTLRGDRVSFTAGADEYTGRVTGDRIEGRVVTAGTGGAREFVAVRVPE